MRTASSIPNLSTTIENAANAAVPDEVPLGTVVHDTATIEAGFFLFPPSGTVTYNFYPNDSCDGPLATTQTVTITVGGTFPFFHSTIPDSAPTLPLEVGGYSYRAHYSGDSANDPVTAECEHFIVVPGDSTTATTVYDASNLSPWNGTEVSGAQAIDQATVHGVPGITPTGTVEFTFFHGANCNEDVSKHTSDGTLSGGVAYSSKTPPLPPGHYSYRAAYTGDDNYHTSHADCENFTVNKATPLVCTTVWDPALNGGDGGPWAGTETTGRPPSTPPRWSGSTATAAVSRASGQPSSRPLRRWTARSR